jgi:hypothetical protein
MQLEMGARDIVEYNVVGISCEKLLTVVSVD